MRPSKLLRTSTFRLALIYLVLFGLSVVALFAFVYWNTAVFIAEQTDLPPRTIPLFKLDRVPLGRPNLAVAPV